MPGGIAEQNYVCADPLFAGKRAARVEALCSTYAGKGSPIDFVSSEKVVNAGASGPV